MKKQVIIYPFPMNLSQGSTYHLSILQFIEKLTKYTPVVLLSLDTREELEQVYMRELGFEFPQNLNLLTINNRKWGFKSSRLWFLREAIKSISQIIKQFESVYLYTRNVKQMAHLIRYWKKQSAPNLYFVFESHQLLSINLAMQMRCKKAKEEYKYEDTIYKNTDLVFVNTPTLGRQIERTFGKPCKVLPVATNGKNIISINQASTMANRDYELIYMGTFAPWKGVETIIDAIKLLVSKGWSKKALLVGAVGKQRDDFSKLISDNNLDNHIDLLGKVPKKEVVGYLDKAKIGLVPNSLQEDSIFNTSPLKIFDYAARGLHIVCSRTPALSSSIPDNIVHWFEPDDPYSLASAISYISIDSGFNTNAINWAKDNTWDFRAQKAMTFLNELPKQ